MADKPLCAIEGCDKFVRYTRPGSVCVKHYQRMKRRGTYDDPPPSKNLLRGPAKRGPDFVPWLLATLAVPSEACIDWPGPKDHEGYGHASYQGRRMGAHRLACELTHGAPNGRHALHSCDNPSCVNPAHLRWGTDADNVADAIARGRRAIGEMMPHAKVTSEQAREIFLSPETELEVSARYGVGRSLVSRIRRRLKWRHATEGLSRPDRRRSAVR